MAIQPTGGDKGNGLPMPLVVYYSANPPRKPAVFNTQRFFSSYLLIISAYIFNPSEKTHDYKPLKKKPKQYNVTKKKKNWFAKNIGIVTAFQNGCQFILITFSLYLFTSSLVEFLFNYLQLAPFFFNPFLYDCHLYKYYVTVNSDRTNKCTCVLAHSIHWRHYSNKMSSGLQIYDYLIIKWICVATDYLLFLSDVEVAKWLG